MKKRTPLVWPPKVGARIHHDVGFEWSAWSGEVRAVVDDEVAVVWWRKREGWHDYRLVRRIEVELEAPRFFEGPLPRTKRRAP